MTLDDWIMALHVLSAFALVAAIVTVWAGYAALDAGGASSAPLARMFKVGAIVVGLGATGTLVFGVWLAISLEAYDPWDGWIVAALLLWLIGSGASGRAGKLSQQPGGLRPAVALHAIASLSVVLILVDMLWKPGA